MVNKKLTFLLIILLTFLISGCANLFDHNLDNNQREFDFNFPNRDFNQFEYSKDHLLIRYSSIIEVEKLLQDFASEVLIDWDKVQWAKVSVPEEFTVPEFISLLEASEFVHLAEPDYLLELPEVFQFNEDDFDSPIKPFSVYEDRDLYNLYIWGMENINAPQAWEVTTGCENVVVAIIDTGVAHNPPHSEYANQVFVAPFNATLDGHPAGANDIHGHGTHVSGTAVASGLEGRIIGVSWDSPVMPIRVMDSGGTILSSYTINGFNHIMDYLDANEEKRVVVNYSIGGRGYSYALNDTLDKAIQDYNVLMVTSAGNSYKRVMSYPGGHNSTLSVAASNPLDGKADFSTIGWWNSVAAPGDWILSIVPGDRYSFMGGTSMASPHVAGAVALLLSIYPDLTPVQIINQVEQTARPSAYGEGFTEEMGYGILDVEALIGELQPMQYGALTVESNVIYGLINIFDDTGTLITFGATGDNFNRYFPALKPGTYTVAFSFDGQFVGQEQVTITVEGSEVVSFTVDLVE